MGSRLALAAAAIVLLLSASALADPPAAPGLESSADSRESPPPSASTNAVLGGIGMTALWYGAAAGMSFAFPDAPGAHDLRLPIVGPWLAIANNGCSSDEPDCSQVWVALRTIITAIDGIGQAAGPAIVLEGLLLHTERYESSPEPARVPSTPAPSKPATEPKPSDGGKNLFYWMPLPRAVGMRGVGLGISGRF